MRETGWTRRSGSVDPGVASTPRSWAIRRVGHGAGSSALDERTRWRDGPPRRAGPSETDRRTHYAPRGPLCAASEIGDPRVRARLADPSVAGSLIRLSIEAAPRIEPSGASAAGTGPTRLPAWHWDPCDAAVRSERDPVGRGRGALEDFQRSRGHGRPVAAECRASLALLERHRSTHRRRYAAPTRTPLLSRQAKSGRAGPRRIDERKGTGRRGVGWQGHWGLGPYRRAS